MNDIFVYTYESGYEATIDLLPYYSEDIAAAWEVVETACESSSLYFRLHRNPDYIWAAFDRWSDARLSVEAQADTAPLAISRAALLAVMEAE